MTRPPLSNIATIVWCKEVLDDAEDHKRACYTMAINVALAQAIANHCRYSSITTTDGATTVSKAFVRNTYADQVTKRHLAIGKTRRVPWRWRKLPNGKLSNIGGTRPRKLRRMRELLTEASKGVGQ